LAGEEGGAEMRKESKRAAVDAAAQRNATTRRYPRVSWQASTINSALAALVFNLQSPSTDARERAAALDAIDTLIRLKIDTGLLRGGSL
jgi:hypothetical protein